MGIKCLECGKSFDAHGQRKYCSAECKDARNDRAYKEQRKLIIKKAILAGRKCLSCGKPLFAWSRKFCSDDCRAAGGRAWSNKLRREIVLKIYPEAAEDLARLKEAWERRSECAE